MVGSNALSTPSASASTSDTGGVTTVGGAASIGEGDDERDEANSAEFNNCSSSEPRYQMLNISCCWEASLHQGGN